MTIKRPAADSQGFFGPSIGKAPSHWPWALPQIYAISIVVDPGKEIVGASSNPDGLVKIRESIIQDRMRYEIIGFWHDDFRVIHSKHIVGRVKAEQVAHEDFKELPVRFLYIDGKVVEENALVEITGQWPAKWCFRRYQDFGVFCAYIYEQLPSGAEAEKFKSMVVAASPITEQLLIYQRCLTYIKDGLVEILSPNVSQSLDHALESIKMFLR